MIQSHPAPFSAILLALTLAARLVARAQAPAARCGATGSGSCFYVDAGAGNDANPGTRARPFRTLSHAAGRVNAGDWVIVRDGVYTGDAHAVLSISRGGSSVPSGLVVFKAEHKWGAVLDGRDNATDAGVVVTAAFVRVEDFDIRNAWHDGVDIGADATQLVGNHIHDIGRICSSSSQGFSAIDIYGSGANVLVEGNIVHRIGRFGPGEQGCSPSNAYWQNHDHGMYIHAGSHLIIRNNVFYDLQHGYQIQFYSGRVSELTLVNNTFAFPNPNRAGQIIVAEPLTTALIANNIFYQPTAYGIEWRGGAADVTVANNLSTGRLSSSGASGVSATGGLEHVDPLFVNPAAFDFHLDSRSPARGAALCSATPATDAEGMPHPREACDIGAYAFHP